MKLLVLLLLSFVFISSVSAIKITEVELNPEGTDAGYEWVEFYSEDELNFNEYKILNNDGDELILNGTFSGYYVYIFSKQWLDNSDEKIFLYKNTELMDETDIFLDSKNDDMTWQLCESWEFKESTKGESNGCSQELEENKDKEETNKTEISEVKKISVSADLQNSSPKETELKAIDLNPKAIKSGGDSEVADKRDYAVYGLIAFGVLLGLLFLIKNLVKKYRYKNELA